MKSSLTTNGSGYLFQVFSVGQVICTSRVGGLIDCGIIFNNLDDSVKIELELSDDLSERGLLVSKVRIENGSLKVLVFNVGKEIINISSNQSIGNIYFVKREKIVLEV